MSRSRVALCRRPALVNRTAWELHHALEAGVLSSAPDIAEMGDIVSGKSPGRQSDDEITICDLTGTGVQDTAIATFTKQRADAAFAGLTVEA